MNELNRKETAFVSPFKKKRHAHTCLILWVLVFQTSSFNKLLWVLKIWGGVFVEKIVNIRKIRKKIRLLLGKLAKKLF